MCAWKERRSEPVTTPAGRRDAGIFADWRAPCRLIGRAKTRRSATLHAFA
ncbi:hypothetical protein LG3211_2021 [Lysobacter gummosus]|nr:hypothetical protein LG3211_2021 [Lysobacter gummosus]